MENAALRKTVEIGKRDRSELFAQLQMAERRSKGKEQAFNMVNDMLTAYPDEFDALLQKSREKSLQSSYTSHMDKGGK